VTGHTPGAETIDSFLARLASAQPAPGGGAAAALAAALIAMVCRISLRRAPAVTAIGAPEGRAAGWPAAIEEIRDEADDLRGRLVAMMEEDADAYAAVIEARRSAAELRRATLPQALQRATTVPLAIARASARLLELADAARAHACPGTIGDLVGAVTLAGGALEMAELMARINLREVEDATYVVAAQATLAGLASEAAALRRRLANMP
jgi:formiminotetrahydrofolate cyclodeaminase